MLKAEDVTLVMVHEEVDPYRKALLADIVTLSLVLAHDQSAYDEAASRGDAADRMWWAGAKCSDRLSLGRLVEKLNAADDKVGSAVVA